MPTFPISGPDQTLKGPNGPIAIDLSPERPTVLVGANGSGKTRLSAEIDRVLSGNSLPVHRISAHRALSLNPDVTLVSLEASQNALWYGANVVNVGPTNKFGYRWQSEPASILLNDFEHLLRVLFAEDSETSSKYRRQALISPSTPVPLTALDRLTEIWQRLLPHRTLHLTPGTVRVGGPGGTSLYRGNELSDGERAIFYLLGQILTVPKDCVVIIDEPELHIHKAILSKLFDEIEAARQDCALLYVTHDLDFAASRRAAQKFFVREYCPSPLVWTIDPIPEDTGFPEQIVTTVLGSRQPVLFIEGNVDSLDIAVYRRGYRHRTLIPLGSCEKVIEATKTFRNHVALHHVGAACLFDSDERSADELQSLELQNIKALPVSEVELLFALPKVFQALSASLNFSGDEKLQSLKDLMFTVAQRDIENIVLKRVKRTLSRQLTDLASVPRTLADLTHDVPLAIAKINLIDLVSRTRSHIDGIIQRKDYEALLKVYGYKGALSEVAKVLGLKNSTRVKEPINLILAKGDGAEFYNQLVEVLPRC